VSPIRLLLADDHAGWRAGIRAFLEPEPDLEVIAEAADGQEIVRLARELRPDILLLDLKMPHLDGVQVTQALHTTLPDVRIVVLTAYDTDVESARALLHLGVRGYLSKAVLAGELVGALRSVHAGHVYLHPMVAALLYAPVRQPDEQEPTAREMEVLRLVAQGHRNAAIAGCLHVSERTVRFHLSNLFSKLGLSSRTELIHLARQKNWLP